MQTLNKNKGTIIAIILIILGIVVYNFFIRNETIALPSGQEASQIGNEVVSLLGKLRAVNLDRAVFSSPDYLLLTDFSAEIQPQPVGRPNPFEVIGRD